jgi:D-alanyl-D-alanine carboxypeptidase
MRFPAVVFPVAALLVACAPGRSAPSAPAPSIPSALELELASELAREIAAHPSIPGQLLRVHVPRQGIEIAIAAGVAERASGRPLAPGDRFRIASVTKTFTAATVLRLAEQGTLAVDDPIGRHLPEVYARMLREGGYAPERITVRHLLTHTSGIHDYATDERFFEAVVSAPRRRWTRREQVEAALAWGRPHFEPAEGYHYSDTGYLLLAEIVEAHTGGTLGEAFRSLLRYDELGLRDTWLESLEPPAAGWELSHPYLGEMDGMGIDPSVDLFGGGGLVSSTADLVRFYRALLGGRILRDPATLALMLDVPVTNRGAPGGPYAMGIASTMIGGETCWGHTGFWGTTAYHCPRSDVTIVRQINQAQPGEGWVHRAMLVRVAERLGMGR